jgi:uncharacterized OB-fold protein
VSALPASALPDASDPLMAGFWEASRRHVLVIQRCKHCGEVRFPPLPICSNCWSEDQSWVETEPTGTVYSYVVYHRALAAAFADEVPYAIGRVKVTAGPIFTVRLDVPLDEITVDMPVTASFRDASDEISLLQFTKVECQPPRSSGGSEA